MGQAQQKRRAVLVVEDDAELRSLTAALLEDEKVDTIECDSAEVVPREPRPWHSPSDTLGRVLVCPNDTGNLARLFLRHIRNVERLAPFGQRDPRIPLAASENAEPIGFDVAGARCRVCSWRRIFLLRL
jgi:hypothetical protein